VAAGPPITSLGGHCHFLGGEVGPDVRSLRAAVRERVERGVDVIKVMASGGHLTPGSRQERSQFGLDELRAVVEEGHRYGLSVIAHAHGGRAIADAAAAGVEGLTNRQIAAATHISERTAESHVQHILRKLGYTTRSQIAAWVAGSARHPHRDLTDQTGRRRE
jgi:imidazolonepropionase-like amidohydrolase